LRRIPYSSFESFSTLFQNFISSPDTLSNWFGGDYRDTEFRKERIDAVLTADRDRAALVSVLRRQAAEWGLLDTSAPLIARLEAPDTLAVVTGQQLGLFGGPLYTLFKTLSAIQISAKMEEESGKACVPVFWLEGEDHDVAEIAWAGLLDGDDPVRVEYAPDSAERGTATGRMVLDSNVLDALDRVDQLLQPTDFKPDLMEALRSAWVPGRRLIHAFAVFMDRLVGPGRVVFISPDDAELKALGAHVFEHEINDWSGSLSRLEAASSQIAERWHTQVTPSATNLFLHTDTGRQGVKVVDGALRLSDGNPVTEAELLDRLASDPGSFSPNVVLRPLLQDTLLPTAAYVAGPGEIAYFAQFRSLYAWADVPMPIIWPRSGGTLLEGRIDKILQRYALDVPDFEDQLERLFRRVVVANMDVDLDDAFSEAGKHIHEAVNAIKPVVSGVDKSLLGAAEATRASFMKDWNKLKQRVVKAERSQQDIVCTQLRRAQANLMPNGLLQERFLSPLYFLNKYGMDLSDRLLDTLSTDTDAHQVVSL